jgi:ribosomal protein S18 acetylase RimI-like enzyme
MAARRAVEMSLAPFSAERLGDAAQLLAARERRTPTGAGRLSVAAARRLLDELWQRPRTAGQAALRGGRLVGFLLGYLVIDDVWGRVARVAPFGHALAPGERDETYRDLYAALATGWTRRGCYSHAALLPSAAPAAIAAWHALGFGLDQAQGLLALSPRRRFAPAAVAASVEIARATREDLDEVVSLAGLVFEAQTRAPVFSPFLPEYKDDWETDYAAMLADDDTRIWLARVRGRPAGFCLLRPFESTAVTLQAPPGTVEIVVLAVAEPFRGKALGRALVVRGLEDARARGYAQCLAMWRVPNLAASRFWPKLGFTPAIVRVSRTIDPRIAWATG